MCLGFGETEREENEEFMYAIIETGGKQYRVKEGDILRVEKLPFEPGDVVELENVLLVRDGDRVNIGNPMLSDVRVSAKILAQGKSRKILVFKYKPKKNYRKRYGHRQPYTEIQIEKIEV
jgi:large subunit ribosomal protein L21